MNLDLVDGVLNFNFLDVKNIGKNPEKTAQVLFTGSLIKISVVSSCQRYKIIYYKNWYYICDVKSGTGICCIELLYTGKLSIHLDREISGRWTLLRLCHALMFENHTLLDSTLFSTIDEFAN